MIEHELTVSECVQAHDEDGQFVDMVHLLADDGKELKVSGFWFRNYLDRFGPIVGQTIQWVTRDTWPDVIPD